ncbi:MAG: hypothetical protein P8I95_00205 [Alphaproteobacteria bacterium]|nr:hypothetical protein [Alphaproteobacteria bacterium]
MAKYTQAMFEDAAGHILHEARQQGRTSIDVSVGDLLDAVKKEGDNPPTPSAKSALERIAYGRSEVIECGKGTSSNSRKRKYKINLTK